MQLVIISGRSGSGKSIALQALEDLGFYAIDNLPAMLLAPLIDELEAGSPHRRRVAVSIDARNLPTALEQFPGLLESLTGRGLDCQVVYLTAEPRVLLERYAATRRRHPLTRESDMTLAEAIESEEQFLSPIRHTADLVIDTSNLTLHDLRSRISEQVARDNSSQMTLTLESFGFKRGVPLDADLVFDARCLPNPYWDPRLRGSTGQEQAVIDFLEQYPDVEDMFIDIRQWLDRWLPAYTASRRSYLTVAIGCTGGQHRSGYLIERLGAYLAERFPSVRIRHRELTVQRTLGRASDGSA
ncbi:RNase adapter RapZ [Kushneria phosphatilytica]|uniref:RNase adapter RapZ n=1 Tax=Kushneria phosphatilytica TaxID=657387 RepID=UPI0008D94762|nr:RNase adapter RapZ [Kushneria phosphatilytica]OHV12256.1 RNase adaptor protein RapZ [Kushneria phosphatilytica]